MRICISLRQDCLHTKCILEEERESFSHHPLGRTGNVPSFQLFQGDDHPAGPDGASSRLLHRLSIPQVFRKVPDRNAVSKCCVWHLTAAQVSETPSADSPIQNKPRNQAALGNLRALEAIYTIQDRNASYDMFGTPPITSAHVFRVRLFLRGDGFGHAHSQVVVVFVAVAVAVVVDQLICPGVLRHKNKHGGGRGQ